MYEVCLTGFVQVFSAFTGGATPRETEEHVCIPPSLFCDKTRGVCVDVGTPACLRPSLMCSLLFVRGGPIALLERSI